MKTYLKLIITLTSLVLISSCTCSGNAGFHSEKTTTETKTITYPDGKVKTTEKKDKDSIAGELSVNKSFLVKNANNQNSKKPYVDSNLGTKSDSLFDRKNSIIKDKLAKVDNQLKITQDAKAYYINGNFKDMTPTNIKFIVKNNHLKITMDLEKQSGSLTRSSSFTRMFPISHEVDKSKAKTIIKNNEVSITLPKL